MHRRTSSRKIDLSAAKKVMEGSTDLHGKLPRSNSGLLRHTPVRGPNSSSNSRSGSLFNVHVLKGMPDTNSRQMIPISLNFDSGKLYLNNVQIKMADIYRVRLTGETQAGLYINDHPEIVSPLQLQMEDTGTRRELCIYVRLFRPDAQFDDASEMMRDGGVMVFKAFAPYGRLHRKLACLFVVDSQAGTVTFVPGENEQSSKARCFAVNQATQIVQQKTQVVIAFDDTVEPVTAIFRNSYQCLRFATWMHRLRHLSSTKIRSLGNGGGIPLPPPPTAVFHSGKTFDNSLSIWCGTWNVGEAEPGNTVGWLDPMVPMNNDIIVLALQGRGVDSTEELRGYGETG